VITTINAKAAKAAKPRFSLRTLRTLRLTLWLVFVARAVSAQQTHIIVVTGVPGDEEHATKFKKWATTFIDAAKKKESVPDANIALLAGEGARRENVSKTFAAVAARAKPGDAVVVLLIGHGSFDGRAAAFNIPGPDLTVDEWAKLLNSFPSQRVAFVNTASSSGAFLPTVAAPGRVIIAATKTGGERNDTDFPEFFVGAFDDPAADSDRNGHVSIFEAFEYAKAKVAAAVKQKGNILTEHATMDEGGADARLAATIFLGTGRTDAALNVDMNDPVARALVQERDALEQQIAALRLKKTSMDAAAYDAEMEKLLTSLALKTKALRDSQTKKDDR
jgi:hypothetical protein